MNWKFFLVIISHVLALQQVTCELVATAAHEKFALKLTSAVGLENPKDNVIISPLLLQTVLTLLYYGASDETGSALRSALELQSFASSKLANAKLSELLGATRAQSLPDMSLVNGIFVQERYTFNFKNDFIDEANKLDIQTERLNFDKSSVKALQTINQAFQIKTNYKINEVVNAQALLQDQTPFLLLAAVALKTRWAYAFDSEQSEKLNFYSDLNNFKSVGTMFLASHKLKYAEIKDLDAKAVELPFEHSDLRMLILLPNKIDGLSALEQKLKNENLVDLTRQLSEQKIALTLPKFKLEQSTDLKPVLMQFGLSNIFTSAAKFSHIFSTLLPGAAPYVTAIQQTTCLNVDETGGSTSGSGFSLSSLFKRPTRFYIDHPFYFAIRTNDAVLLAGHIINL